LALLIIARRRMNGIDERRILASLVRFAIGSLVMAAAIMAMQSVFSIFPLPEGLPAGPTLRPAIEIGVPLVIAGVVGLIVYVVAASAVGSKEVQALPRLLARRRIAKV
jgi:hypothetical protein